MTDINYSTIKQIAVYNCTGKTSKFKNQDFFSNLNWANFKRGDIICLKGYGSLAQIIAGVFIGLNKNGDPAIRLMTNRHSLIFKNHSLQNILDSNNATYWEQKYLG